MKRNNGIYEEVISNELSSELSTINDSEKYIDKIDPEEAPAILADYAAKIIKHKLQVIQEKSNNIEEQIRLVNQVIDSIEDSSNNDKISIQGEQLKTLLIDDPRTKVSDYNASIYPRPVTSISDSSLFTGSKREPSMASEINKEIDSCDRIDMMVSFIRWSGIILILDKLRSFVESGKKLRIITTSYMGATELRAVEELSKLPNTEIKVSLDGERTRLHAKVYIFHRDTGYSTAYVGSSNLTAPAMTSGCEWNVKVTKNDLSEVFSKINASYEGYWNSEDFEVYTSEKRHILEEALNRANKRSNVSSIKRNFFLDVKPYPYQQEILDTLEAERTIRHSYRNLVCAATGTGKTIISAFDYRNQCEKENRRLKLLFVAHRQEILEQSIECYREVLQDSDFADVFYSGQEPTQLDYLFASINIINSRNFTNLPEDYYDFIILDECHHMAAKSYKVLFDHFKPKYFLGLTATPERMDGESILPYFNNKLAAEIRLPEAINRKLLCPFQYFCVSDSVDLSTIKWKNRGYDKKELENIYVLDRAIADKRANLIIKSVYRYIGNIDNAKGLVFCATIEHAKYMSEQFNSSGIPTTFLTGNSSDTDRANAKSKLQNGDIKFICVVDLYNEGVDIKQINTVLFLRPTESLTIFLQQLGRGLRLADGKDCLTVLDFIGQANKKYSFESKFSSLLQTNNQGLKKELESDFPHLPKGCYIRLEKKAKEHILSNIKNALNGKSGIVSKLVNYESETGNAFTLNSFLNYYTMHPKKVYRHKITATEVLNNLPNDADKNMWKKLFRLSSVNSADFLIFMINNLRLIETFDINNTPGKNMYFWKMLHATFIDDHIPTSDADVMSSLINYWKSNSCYIDETLELLNYNYNQIDFIERNSGLPYENSLKVYSTYTRAQALAMLDYWNKSSEGVTRIANKKTTCLFITLNKGNNYYSPSTAYHDYSINDELFHWQSQNATTPTSQVGKRFINQEEEKENILLFVREQKDDEFGSVPFMFLGRGKFVSYEGSKPMSIVWRLENKIPAKFLDITDKLGIG